MFQPKEGPRSRVDASSTGARAVPVRVGQLVEVEVAELVAGGEALARLDGFAVFVPKGVPGDRLKVEIVSTKPGYARGLIREILVPGAERIEARCPVFGKCGGCQWQHVAYPAQLEAKRRLVAEALTRIGRFSVTDPLPSSKALRDGVRLGHGSTAADLEPVDSHGAVEVAQDASMDTGGGTLLANLAIQSRGAGVDSTTDGIGPGEVSMESTLGAIRPSEVGVEPTAGAIRPSEANVEPTVGMGEPWYYRNKAHWAIAPAGVAVRSAQHPPGAGRHGKQGKGRPGRYQVPEPASTLQLGLYEARSHRIVEPPSCGIQQPVLNLVLDFLRKTLPDFDLEVYDEQTGKGWLRSAFAKIGYATDQLMIGLVATSGHFPQAHAFVEAVLQKFPRVDSIVLNVNPARSNVLLGERTELLWGKPFLEERVGGLAFRLSARSFFQVNPLQTERLFDTVREFAQLTGRELVVDAFCGTGTISLLLAGQAAEVWGLEAEPAAIRDAEENARHNGIDHAHFLLGRVEERLPKLVREGLAPDVVVLDPPRKGCEPEVIAAIAAAAPARVVYVSCNPATLARDLAAFREGGYDLIKVRPLDMFPQTAHVEAVALLERRARP